MRAAFRDVLGASIFIDADFAESNFWLVTMKLDTPDEAVRDALLEMGRERGLLCRPAWKDMHHLPMYRDCPRAEIDPRRSARGADRQSAVVGRSGDGSQGVIVENGEPRIDR
jgi:hypothetical protein